MTRCRPTIFRLFLFIVSVTAGTRAAASPMPSQPSDNETSIPLIEVEKGGKADLDVLNAAAKALASPTMTGQAVQSALNLVLLPKDFTPESVEKTYAAGEAAFFNGKLEGAKQSFENAAALLTTHAEVTTYFPKFRALRFKSQIYLAIIAHGVGDTETFKRNLQSAAEMAEMTPSATEFPPWVCTEFDAAKKRLEGRAAGSVLVNTHKGCLVSVNGRYLGEGPLFANIPVGSAHIRVRCGENAGPVQVVEIEKDRTVELTPLLIRSATVELRDTGLVLTAAPTLRDDALSRDLAAVGKALRKDRLAAVVLEENRVSVLLIDAGLGKIVRRASLSGRPTPDLARAAAQKIVEETNVSPPVSADVPSRMNRRPRYKDWAAWTAAVSGAAALGAGIGLQLKYGLSSSRAPVAISLISVGAGLLTASGFMFMVQPSQNDDSARRSDWTACAFVGGTF